MGKKKQPSSNEKPELAVKVDSTEPKKSGREPNEPVYDVAVNASGAVDVVSNEELDNVDYPPEFAEYLGMLFEGIHESLGLSENEEIPEEVINEYIAKLVANADIEKLIQELNLGKVFGMEDAKGAEEETFQSEDSEPDVPEQESLLPIDFSDEELIKMAIEDLPVESDGTRVWMTSDLEAPEGAIGRIKLVVPVITDEEMVKNKVVFRITVPYVEEVKFEDVEKNEDIIKDKPCIGTGDGVFYVIAEETLKSYDELMVLAGYDTSERDKIPEDQSILDAVKSELSQFAPRENGYYEDLMEYWYNGKVYHEKDVIWLEVPSTRTVLGNMKGFLANQSSDGFLTAVDISNVKGVEIKNGRKVLTNNEKFEIMYQNQKISFFEQPTPAEETWWLAKEYAKTKDSIGYAVVCLKGKFYIPVEDFVNFQACEIDSLAIIFNVIHCMPTHHACVALIVGDIGNLQLQTFVRYHKGGIFDWQHRFDQEMKMMRKYNPDFDPYDDPYDSPDYGMFDGGDEG